MVRFKDVTKVVLVLALCFGFAGVGSAAEALSCDGYRRQEYDPAHRAYKEAKNAYINAEADYQQAGYINVRHEECKKNSKCKYSASKHEANKVDEAAHRARADEYKKILEGLYMEYMSKKADLKFYCKLPVVDVDENKK
jgi:hypothetical protein